LSSAIPTNQIGKRLTATLSGQTVTLKDPTETTEHTLKLTPQKLDLNERRRQIEGMEIEDSHKQIILKILFLLEESPPELATFDTLAGDFFGKAFGEHNLIALHKSLKDNPVALFHEILHLLVDKGLISLEFRGDATQSKKGELIIKDKSGKKISKINLWDKSLSIALKGPDNPHYLLRAFQREVFKGIDTALTREIKEIEIKEIKDRSLLRKLIEKMRDNGLSVVEPVTSKSARSQIIDLITQHLPESIEVIVGVLKGKDEEFMNLMIKFLHSLHEKIEDIITHKQLTEDLKEELLRSIKEIFLSKEELVIKNLCFEILWWTGEILSLSNPLVKRLKLEDLEELLTEEKRAKYIFGDSILRPCDLNNEEFQRRIRDILREVSKDINLIYIKGRKMSKVIGGPFCLSIMLLPTKECPFKCPHCYLPSTPKRGKDLTPEDVEKIFTDIPWTIGKCIISGGEPFLNKDIDRIIKKIPISAEPIYIVTNAIIFDTKKKATELLEKLKKKERKDTPFRFTTSLDDFHLRKNPTEVLRNIANLLEAIFESYSEAEVCIISCQPKAIRKSNPLESLKEELERRGYEVRFGDLKHVITSKQQKMWMIKDVKEKEITKEITIEIRVSLETYGRAIFLPEDYFPKRGLEKEEVQSFKLVIGVFTITPDGEVTWNESLPINPIFNPGNIKEGWEAIKSRIDREPISNVLTFQGMHKILEFVEEYDEDLVRTLFAQLNHPIEFLHWILVSPERMLYITFRILQEYLKDEEDIPKNWPYKKILSMKPAQLKEYVNNLIGQEREKYAKEKPKPSISSIQKGRLTSSPVTVEEVAGELISRIGGLREERKLKENFASIVAERVELEELREKEAKDLLKKILEGASGANLEGIEGEFYKNLIEHLKELNNNYIPLDRLFKWISDNGIERIVSTSPSLIRITSGELSLLDPEEKWWLKVPYWKNKGKPKEQISLKIDGYLIDIYNWREGLTEEEIKTINSVLRLFLKIANGEAVKNSRYILIDDVQKINPYSGKEQNGERQGYSNNTTILYPNAFRQISHRVEDVFNLEGTMIYELTHGITDKIINEWKEEFGWKEASSPRVCPGGAIVYFEVEDPSRCPTKYATFNPGDDIADSMVVALKNPEILDKGRYEFLKNTFLRDLLRDDLDDNSILDSSIGSSPIFQKDKKGGVDFRTLPIPPAQPLEAIPGQLPPNSSFLLGFNLTEEWQQIELLIERGIIPSAQRLKEYLLDCLQNGNFKEEIDKILLSIAEILRLEEEYSLSAESALREILVLLESDRPIPELQVALNEITVLPKEFVGIKNQR